MSNNQMHGKRFEDSIKSAYPGAADAKRGRTKPVADIEARYDGDKKMATSIKTSMMNRLSGKPKSSLEMAQASKFAKRCMLGQPLRVTVIDCKQSKEYKIPQDIVEWELSANTLKSLLGSNPKSVLKDIESFEAWLSRRADKEKNVDDATAERLCQQRRKDTLKWVKKFRVRHPDCKVELAPKNQSRTRRGTKPQARIQARIKRATLSALQPSTSHGTDYPIRDGKNSGETIGIGRMKSTPRQRSSS